MPDEKVLQVAILIWGCVFCAIAALCIFLSSNYDREKRRYLILMESFASMLLLVDAMAYIFSGYPGVPGSVMVRISSFLVFLLSDVVLLCFHIYVCLSVFEEGAENIKKSKSRICYCCRRGCFCGDLAVYSLVLLHRCG